MKKIVLSLTFGLVCCYAHSQKINFLKSFDAAVKQAADQKKMLFVFFGQPNRLQASPLNLSELASVDVSNFYNHEFVNYALNYADTSAVSKLKKYPITVFPAYLFIDHQGNLIYKELGNFNSISHYIDMGAKALTLQTSGKTLTAYTERYKRGNYDAVFIHDYIKLRQDLFIEDNAELADEYADLLTVRSFNDYQQVLFILLAGPFVYGKAYNLCFTNRKITDSIYKTEPQLVRSVINFRMAGNTINKAIAKKNANMAQQAAMFQASLWGRDYKRAEQASGNVMLNYYKAIKDTGSYYKQALNYYDMNYMNVSSDSSKKLNEASAINTGKLFKDFIQAKTKSNATKGNSPATGGAAKATAISVTPLNSIATVLNNVAYEFYISNTHNQNYLLKAVSWSKRSIELNPLYNYYDTLAHLLYRLNFFKESEYTQEKAIAIAETNGTPKTEISKLKDELSKIKARQI